jgi:hypothetical protein
MIPTVEQKQEIINCVKELQKIVMSIPNLETCEQKKEASRKMENIMKKIKKFRKEYPDA